MVTGPALQGQPLIGRHVQHRPVHRRGKARDVPGLDDVGDAEKPYLMAGCAAFVLPSKPRPEFVETFGIALAEKMLAGGGPVITTVTGGIGEAVGDHALIIPVEDPQAIAEAIDRAILETTAEEHKEWADRAREYAMQFDRRNVFDKMFAPLRDSAEVPHQ